MRRGFTLETQFNNLIKYVNASGGHAHKNNASRLIDGTFVQGEPFDYEVFIDGKMMMFDAKECKADKWQFFDKDVKQAENLKNCKANGFDAFFAVYFYNTKKLIKFDVDIFIKALADGRKSLTPSEGSEWSFEEFRTRNI